MHSASTLVLPASADPWIRPAAKASASTRLGFAATGVGSRATLRAAGYTDRGLREAVRDGSLRRITAGWYATVEGASTDIARAIRLRHRLTCIDAARIHGLWTPSGDSSPGGDLEDDATQRLHLYRRQDQGPTPPDTVRHLSRSRTWTEPDPVASVPLLLEHALLCQSGETAAVLLESAVHQGRISPSQAQALLDAVPVAVRSRVGALSSASESGSETRVARWLRRRGFTVEQQVFVAGVGFVDLYVAGLFIEVDGRGPHTAEKAFAADRRRDLFATAHGLQVLRLSYAQVWHQWEDTTARILTAIDAVGSFGRRKVGELLAS